MLKNRTNGRHISLFIAAELAAIFWLILSLAEFYGAAPADDIGREIFLTSIDNGETEMALYQIDEVQYPAGYLDEDQVTLAAIDGDEVSMMTLDSRGNVSHSARANLDISSSAIIRGAVSPEGNMFIGYRNRMLHVTELNSEADGYTAGESVILEGSSGSLRLFPAPDTGIFAVYGDYNGLYVMAIGGSTQQSAPLMLSTPGTRVNSWVAAAGSPNPRTLQIFWNEDGPSGRTRIMTAAISQDDSGLPSSGPASIVLDNIADDYLKTLRQAVWTPDNSATGSNETSGRFTLFAFFRDRRFYVHTITPISISLNNDGTTETYFGEPETPIELPYYDSRYIPTLLEDGTWGMLYQGQTISGVNILEMRFSLDMESPREVLERSSTRDLSRVVYRFPDGAVLFEDLERYQRKLYLAPTDPQLIAETSGLLNANPLRVLSNALVLIFSGFFIGLLYIIPQAPLPLVVSLLLDRFSKVVTGPGTRKITAVSAGLHLIIQLGIGAVLLSKSTNTLFNPYGLPSIHWILAFLPIKGVIAYITAAQFHDRDPRVRIRYLEEYIRFAVFDYLLLVPLLFSYIWASVLIGSI